MSLRRYAITVWYFDADERARAKEKYLTGKTLPPLRVNLFMVCLRLLCSLSDKADINAISDSLRWRESGPEPLDRALPMNKRGAKLLIGQDETEQVFTFTTCF